MLGRVPGGLLIAVEGIDGAGKTSFCALASQYFGERGIGCVLSKEPTSGKWGKELRESAKAERLTLESEIDLFIKDRKDHVEKFIQPALDENLIVILDRYYYSSAAYQGARGADPTEIINANEKFAPTPDLFLLLDVEPKTGIGRISKRGDIPNEFESLDGLTKAKEIFNSIETPCKRIVDGNAEQKNVVKLGIELIVEALKDKISSTSPDSKLLSAFD